MCVESISDISFSIACQSHVQKFRSRLHLTSVWTTIGCFNEMATENIIILYNIIYIFNVIAKSLHAFVQFSS